MDTHQVLNCDAFEAVCVDFLCLWFEKGQKIIEYTKDEWIYQNHHDILQWARNVQIIIRYGNELKFIYLLRE